MKIPICVVLSSSRKGVGPVRAFVAGGFFLPFVFSGGGGGFGSLGDVLGSMNCLLASLVLIVGGHNVSIYRAGSFGKVGRGIFSEKIGKFALREWRGG